MGPTSDRLRTRAGKVERRDSLSAGREPSWEGSTRRELEQRNGVGERTGKKEGPKISPWVQPYLKPVHAWLLCEMNQQLSFFAFASFLLFANQKSPD